MMKWDSDGDILSCISEKSSHLFLWDSTQKKVMKVDSGAKDAHSVLAWSGREAVLVIGEVFCLVVLKLVFIFFIEKKNA